ncbi:enoyl-CoA hydratase-related protein [Novosphingobium cyanobacteriorum]|uniref:Enoyl-CoA hydratase-related protein n=1 Tax=Novosphingobium cyanobacteriorum TaxID=3024215 RepID=A0ABT6CM11_9SPHN|nr:enoyl-CoA hydratase-related protein [Novosphingobium cyanobacteriorum]MDF8334957.1 enoyl-CoA hydratase-related protein [Novosphingobium cyanobacteriorum]
MADATVERIGSALAVTFTRPDKLNALTYEMHGIIRDAIDQADRDDAVRALIFTGTGRGFCAGTDLASGFSRISSDSAEAPTPGELSPRDKGGEIVLRLFDCHKPVIGAVNGIAAGMGAALTLPMDYRIGTPETRYIFPYVKRGIAPESCSSWFLPRIVGVNRALEWFQTGRPVPAQEALESGLLTDLVVDPVNLMEAALAVAARIADGTSSLAVSLARHMVWQGMAAPHPMVAHRHESRALVYMQRSGDPREGARAFMEKRPPEFSGSVAEALKEQFVGWEAPPYDPTSTARAAGRIA